MQKKYYSNVVKVYFLGKIIYSFYNERQNHSLLLKYSINSLMARKERQRFGRRLDTKRETDIENKIKE